MSAPNSLSPAPFLANEQQKWSHYVLHHYRDEVQYPKKVMCRTINCECCSKTVALWIQVEYGDETQNVLAVYCSEDCASKDGYARVEHCFNHRAGCSHQTAPTDAPAVSTQEPEEQQEEKSPIFEYPESPNATQ